MIRFSTLFFKCHKICQLAALLLFGWLTAGPAGAQTLPVIQKIRLVFEPVSPPYLSEMELQAVTGLTPGTAPGREAIRNAIKNLYQLGFFRQVEARLEAGSSGPELVFRLVPFGQLAWIRWEGFGHLKKKEIATRLELNPGTLITDERLESARNKILARCREYGFYDARLEMHSRPAGDRTGIVWHLTEGPRYRLLPAEPEFIDGRRIPAVVALLRPLHLRPYRAEDLTKMKTSLLKEYRKAGFIASQVEYFTLADPVLRTITPVFILEAGPRVSAKVEGAAIPAKDLRQILAIYRLGDVSEYAEDLSRNDLTGYLIRQGLPVVSLESQRIEDENADTLDFVFRVQQGERLPDAPLSVKGNHLLSRKEILEIVEANPPSPWTARLPGDHPVPDLADAYRRLGYHDARIVLSLLPVNNRFRAVIQVEEGDPLRLAAVEIHAPEKLATSVTLPDFHSDYGQILTEALLMKIRNTINETYSRYGYSMESLPMEMSRNGLLACLVFNPAVSGPTHLNRLIVSGRQSIHPEVLKGMIPLQPDTPLDYLAIQRAESRLYRSGVFEKVGIRTPAVEGKPASHNVVFELQEAPRYVFGYGAGYQVWEKVRGFLEFTDNNFLRRGLVMGMLLRGSAKKGLFQWSLHGEGIIRHRLPLTLYLFTEYSDHVSYTSRRISMLWQTMWQSRRGNRWLASLGFEEIKNYHIDASYDPGKLDQDEQPISLITMSLTRIQDRRDDPINPRRGTLQTISATLAPRLFRAGTGFIKGVFQQQYYRTLGEELVLALSFRCGAIQPVQGTRDIPISERFFAGGPATLRGYGVDRAGPLDPVTLSPLGGRVQILGNAELRFPIFRQLDGAFFYDAGNVFRTFSDFSLDGLTHSAGAGIRLDTPVGPFRLDFGFSLKDLSHDKRNQIFFTIGHPF